MGKYHIKLNLRKWVSGFAYVDFYLYFANVENLENCTQTITEFDITYEFDGTQELSAYINDDWVVYDSTNILLLLSDISNPYIEFDANINLSQTDSFTWLYDSIKCGFVEVSGGDSSFFLFRLNDERDHINKTLIPIGILNGEFKSPIGIKRIEVDIENYQIEDVYNYVYIPKLKRYYYVTDIQLMNNKFTRLYLQEDVLMSWKDLILLQNAYVTRYGGGSLDKVNDERHPVDDIPTTSYYEPTNLSQVYELKYLMDHLSGQDTTRAPNVMISTYSDNSLFVDDSQDTTAPANSGLPNIQSRRSSSEHHYLVNINDYGAIKHACVMNDAPASYISSIVLYPFDLTTIYPEVIGYRTAHISAGSKVLKVGNVWGDYPTTSNDPTFYETAKGSSQYLVIADFMFNVTSGIQCNDNFLDKSNNTVWEIYIPFVGWVQIDVNKVFNERVLIYYTVDFDSGLSTAYIYNRTKKETIWSASCQIGIKLPVVTSNVEELSRQKQATSLNLLMGVLSSAVAVGIGAYSGNAVAVAGGALSLGKTITSAVNSFNMMIERAQMSYGSSDNALYAPNKVTVRKTTHNSLLTTNVERSIYYHINGYPYRKYVNLLSLVGSNNYYVEVGEIHFDAKGYDIYSTEIDEIVQLLKDGVIL